MNNQLLFLKRKRPAILLLMLFGGAFLCSSFIDPPGKKSGHLPLYKMTPAQVNSIIQGLPLDKRVIFEFIIDGSPDRPADVSWYEASGMNDHAEGELPTPLEKIPNSLSITFYPNSTYVLANNYLFVKSFKTYVRSLPSQNFEYLLFTPEQRLTPGISILRSRLIIQLKKSMQKRSILWMILGLKLNHRLRPMLVSTSSQYS